MWTGANWPSAVGSQTTLNIVTGNSRPAGCKLFLGPAGLFTRPTLCLHRRDATAWFIAVNICTQCCQSPARALWTRRLSSGGVLKTRKTWSVQSCEQRLYRHMLSGGVRTSQFPLSLNLTKHVPQPEMNEPIQYFANSTQIIHFDINEEAILWDHSLKNDLLRGTIGKMDFIDYFTILLYIACRKLCLLCFYFDLTIFL